MSNVLAKYSAAEISKAVAAVRLPAPLQGIECWVGSSSIGGNPAAHIAAVNGKAQAIGLCQLFGDFWFGSEALPNILKGIKNARVRAAFAEAVYNVIRVQRPLHADKVLQFLQDFTAAAMAAEKAPAEKEPAANKLPAPAEKEPAAEAPAAEAPAAEAPAAEKAPAEISALKAEIAALRALLAEQKVAIKAARTLKEVKALVA